MLFIAKTNEQFLINARKVHGDEFEYLSTYIKRKQKIKIKHKKCGHIFEQTPDAHLSGKGCNVCANIIRSSVMKTWQTRASELGRILQHNTAKIFNDSETGFYVNKKIWNTYKNGAKRRNLIFEIKPEDIFYLFKEQKGLCALTGAKLVCDSTNSSKLNWSIDRIDNNSGYTLDNIILVTKQVNMYRNKSTIKEFIELCNMVSCNLNLTEKYKNMTPEEKAEKLKNHSICYSKKKNEEETASIETKQSDAIV